MPRRDAQRWDERWHKIFEAKTRDFGELECDKGIGISLKTGSHAVEKLKAIYVPSLKDEQNWSFHKNGAKPKARTGTKGIPKLKAVASQQGVAVEESREYPPYK